MTIRETRDGDVVSLLRVRLVTGRTHQIRVQLAARAFPLVGDSRYGNARRDARARVKGLKLHACRLLLPPPWNRALEAAPDWAAPWDVPEAATEAFFLRLSTPELCFGLSGDAGEGGTALLAVGAQRFTDEESGSLALLDL